MGVARAVLSDFQIVSKLGSGNYGCVHRVIRKLDKQHYAMKEIDLLSMSKKEAEDCMREATVLAQLEHDYIIRYYDSFIEKGKLYIITELAEGGNLYDFLKKHPGRLNESLIWKLFIQMVLALNHMHKAKILHRDVKTLNVLLTTNDPETMSVKIGDLGVARFLSTKTNFARTLVGTPYYLSPELCEDKPYNEKSDMWALGVVLYECCTQRHPFDAENQGALILKILRGKFPPVTGYSRELVDLVNRCLVLDMNRRPDTDRILNFSNLRRVAEEQQIQLPPPIQPQQARYSPNVMAGRNAGGRAPGVLAIPAQQETKGPLKSSPRSAQALVPSGLQDAARSPRRLAAMPAGNIGASAALADLGTGEKAQLKKQAADDLVLAFGGKVALSAGPPRVQRRSNTMQGIPAAREVPEPSYARCQTEPIIQPVAASKADRGYPLGAPQAAWSENQANDTVFNLARNDCTPQHTTCSNELIIDDQAEECVVNQQRQQSAVTDEEEEDAFDVDMLRAHSVLMDNSAAAIKKQCVAKVGEDAFQHLYQALKSHADEDNENSEAMVALSKALLKIMKSDQSDVLPLLYKLLYVENQRDLDLARVGAC